MKKNVVLLSIALGLNMLVIPAAQAIGGADVKSEIAAYADSKFRRMAEQGIATLMGLHSLAFVGNYAYHKMLSKKYGWEADRYKAQRTLEGSSKAVDLRMQQLTHTSKAFTRTLSYFNSVSRLALVALGVYSVGMAADFVKDNQEESPKRF